MSSSVCQSRGIIIIDGVATSAIAAESNTDLSSWNSPIVTAYYKNYDLKDFTSGNLTHESEIPYSSL